MTPPNDKLDPVGSSWLRRLHIVDRFEERWAERGAADIEEFISEFPTGPSRAALLLELVKVDLECRWSRGEPVPVETYSSRFPELGDTATLPIDLVFEEIRVRRMHGQEPTLKELAERFPGRQADLMSFADSLPIDSAVQGTVDVDLAWADSPISAAGFAGEREFSSGRRLGRYQILERIGRGGFSTVYRAIDTELRREAAVKIPQRELMEDPGARARVMREAQTAARLCHPAIVPIHEVGQDNGTPYIVYQFIPGKTLTELLKVAQPSPQQAARWVACLAEALDYAHQNGIVHRDVKPANVMMMAEAEGRGSVVELPPKADDPAVTSTGDPSIDSLRPMLTDFGLALHTDSGATLTQHGDLLGTPAYMSPEQARGEGHSVDARTDVYSLGVVLYELLAGRRPFEGSGASILQRVIEDEPLALRSVRPGLPFELDTICQRAMAKEASRRYATAGALAADLHAWLEHRPIRARRVGPLARLALWCRRKPALAATIAAAALISLSVTAASFVRIIKERDRLRVERDRAETHLYHSLVRESRAIRLVRGTGYRDLALSRLEEAHRLRTSERNLDELRQEAVACLGDFVGLNPVSWNPRSRPNDYIVAISLPADGDHVALAMADGSVLLTDIASSTERIRLQDGTDGVFDLAFDREAKTLYTADDAGNIRVWQRQADGEWLVTRSFTTVPSQRRGHVNAISLALTPGGQQLMVCPFGAQEISAWNLETGEPVQSIRLEEASEFLSVTISRDGRWLAAPFVGKAGSGVAVWELATRKIQQVLYPSFGMVNRVVFSGDGTLLACACEQGVTLFRTSDFQSHLFVEGDSPYMVAFSPDSRWLAIPSPTRGAVRLWNVANNREVAVLAPGSDEPHAAAFAADGNLLVTASANMVRVWNLRGSGEKLVFAGHNATVNDLAFVPGGKLLASASNDRSVKIWDLATRQLVQSSDQFDNSVTALAVDPAGETLVTGEDSGVIRQWELSPLSGELRSPVALSHDLGQQANLAFSPDGRYLAAGAERGLQLWRRSPAADMKRASHPQLYEPVTTFTGTWASGVCFSPDSRFLAWRDWKGNYVCKVDETQPLQRAVAASETPGHLCAMAFLPDSKHLILAIGNKGVVVQVDSGEVESEFGAAASAGDSNWYTGSRLSIDPQGRLLAIQLLTVPIIHLGEKRILFTLPKESDVPSCLTWNHDGTHLAVGLSDGGLVVWNFAKIRNELARFELAW